MKYFCYSNNPLGAILERISCDSCSLSHPGWEHLKVMDIFPCVGENPLFFCGCGLYICCSYSASCVHAAEAAIEVWFGHSWGGRILPKLYLTCCMVESSAQRMPMMLWSLLKFDYSRSCLTPIMMLVVWKRRYCLGSAESNLKVCSWVRAKSMSSNWKSLRRLIYFL